MVAIPAITKRVDEGVYELRIDYGPGYRLYVALAGDEIVLLLCGGDKTTQQRDIDQAHAAWREYQNRAKQ